MAQFLDPRLPDRFWSKCMPEPNSGCWLWIAGFVADTGYGKFWIDGKTERAHRVSYRALTGAIPTDRIIDHVCRERSCVNPDHLDIVTHYENQHRSPLTPAGRTHCPGGHPYTGDNLGFCNGERVCKACSRAKTARHRARKAQKNVTF